MDQELWFSTDRAKVHATIEESFAWCEGCRLVTDALSSEDGADPFLALAERHASRVQSAILGRIAAAESGGVATLHASGRLRRWVDGADEAVALGQFAWFEREEECRFVLASGTVDSKRAVWTFWRGTKAALPPGLQAVLDDCWASSLPVAADEPLSGHEPAIPTYSRPIPSVREVLRAPQLPRLLRART